MAKATVLVTAAAASWLLTGVVHRLALTRAFLDVPNERSSHTSPTPRGGGLGLVAALLGTVAVSMGARLDLRFLAALAGVILTAGVGWLDDRRSLGVRSRLLAQVVAGTLTLPLALAEAHSPPWLAALVACWWIFWSVSAINVVNFMDGIDGLIGSQALLFGLYLVWAGGGLGDAGQFGAALAGAAAGFLVWNWAPARIFLGDVGSGALGHCFVVGGMLLIGQTGALLPLAYLPLYPIFLDATVTLLRRLRDGERITQAHRTHLYQRLANGGWGHARVALLYAGAALAAFPVIRLPPDLQFIGCAGYVLLVLALGYHLDRGAPPPSWFHISGRTQPHDNS